MLNKEIDLYGMAPENRVHRGIGGVGGERGRPKRRGKEKKGGVQESKLAPPHSHMQYRRS